MGTNSSLGEAVLDLVADGQQLIEDINKEKPNILGALDSIGKVGGALLAAGFAVAATALVAITGMIWDAGEQIDAAYDKIAVSTGATGDALAGLQDDFDAVFTSIPTDADSAAEAIGMLNTRLGLTGEELQTTSANLLEMTRITGGDLIANGEAFTRVIGDWGVPLENAASTLDTVFVASQRTGIGTDRLMQLMVQFGAPLRQFGFGFEQSAAMLSKWEKEGVNTELVMGSLRIAAGKFANENVPLQEGLQQTFEDIKNAEDGSKALAIAMDVFGARAGPDMAAAIRENRFELGDLVGILETADGAIAETSKSTMDWGERWTVFKNRITKALGPAGMGLMSSVDTALGALEGILGRPDIQNGLMAIVDGIVALADTAAANLPGMIDQFFGFVDWLKNNEGVVVAILAVLGFSFLAFGITAAAAGWAALSPLLPIIAAVAAVGVAAYILYTMWTENWYGIQEIVGGFWAWLQPILQNLWNWLQVNIPLALQTMSDYWNNVLLPAIMAVWTWISVNLFPLFMALADFWSAVFNVALTVMAGIWQNVLLPAISDVGNWLKYTVLPIFKTFGNFLSTTLSPVIESLSGFMSGAWHDAFEGISAVIGDVIGFIEDLTEALNNIKLPDWMTPGSPTPWEIGLKGISKAMSELVGAQLPSMSAELNAMAAPSAMLPSDNAAANSGPAVVNVYANVAESMDVVVLAHRVAAEINRRA